MYLKYYTDCKIWKSFDIMEDKQSWSTIQPSTKTRTTPLEILRLPSIYLFLLKWQWQELMQNGWTEKKEDFVSWKVNDRMLAHGIIDETKMSTNLVILIPIPVIILTLVVNFEGLAIHCHVYRSSSYRHRCDTSNNVCLDSQKWCYSI